MFYPVSRLVVEQVGDGVPDFHEIFCSSTAASPRKRKPALQALRQCILVICSRKVVFGPEL